MSTNAPYPVFKNPVDYLIQGCERPWEVAVDPFEVAPRTWFVGNAWVGAYLLETSEGLILIDSTMQPQVYLVFENIRKLGLDPKDIKLLLLTHMHYDHVGGARSIAEASGAKIMLSKQDHEFMLAHPEQIFDEGYPFGSFEVSDFYQDDKPITLGDRTIHTILTPGHTPGTTSFFFDVVTKDGQTKHCGLHGGVGLNTLGDDFLTEHGFSTATRSDYLASMRKLHNFQIDITLGSHPAQVDMLSKVARIGPDCNPFDDPSVWQGLIEQRIGQIETLIAESKLEPAC
ncbi:MBL fold metallo-hydrolase [uncultured Cohaesibacter sp.]|uniref:MBL fold metallo-hydrolase n=1 Tax=uncultured Cohaesibacter sp. TaxID=1002546 RepID=UPI00292D892F|nr:MBL fold metallo-hydrolase [uncultured Cohaesibacter sp.]